MKSTLFLGYGNFDRQDDGVAWHVLAALAHHLGRQAPSSPEESFEPNGETPDFLFDLQLMPEMAETIAAYERVCFVDAHTGRVPEEIHLEELCCEFQTSPFTHHLTACSCLSICEALYGKTPEAILLSVRGYEFGFSQSLSPRTQALVEPAVEKVLSWLNAASPPEA